MDNFVNNPTLLFIILSLATWRLASLLAREDGPFDLFARFRKHVGVERDVDGTLFGGNWFSKGLICLWCNSLWISFTLSLFVAQTPLEWLLYSLALSSMAILIDGAVE